MRNAVGVLGALASVLLLGTGAPAQSDYPNRPVTIVVPFAAGGPSDGYTRALADELSKIWKQQVVVENKPGGGTIVGTQTVAKAKPDGYTLGQVSASFVLGPAVRTTLPYDTLKDFVAVGTYVDAPLAIVAHPSFPANTLPELIAEAKKRPADRPFTYSSAGVGSIFHMASEMMQRKAGITLKHIVYNGEAAGMPDLLGGRVDLQLGTWGNQRPHVESGKLKLIAMMYRKRMPEVPNIPTTTESNPELGLPLGAFNSIVAPAGTAREIVVKIAAAMKQATATKAFEERIIQLASYPQYLGPEDTEAFLKKQITDWTEIAKQANIKLSE
jgi:tripartite-type tricarboxylate transporter receptor subunit TctC